MAKSSVASLYGALGNISNRKRKTDMWRSGIADLGAIAAKISDSSDKWEDVEKGYEAIKSHSTANVAEINKILQNPSSTVEFQGESMKWEELFKRRQSMIRDMGINPLEMPKWYQFGKKVFGPNMKDKITIGDNDFTYAQLATLGGAVGNFGDNPILWEIYKDKYKYLAPFLEEGE